jgi:hypothetical protein
VPRAAAGPGAGAGADFVGVGASAGDLAGAAAGDWEGEGDGEEGEGVAAAGAAASDESPLSAPGNALGSATCCSSRTAGNVSQSSMIHRVNAPRLANMSRLSG